MKIESLNPDTHVVIEIGHVRRDDGWYLWVTGRPDVGPFETLESCQRAIDDLTEMTRGLGAIDVPLGVKN